MSGSLGGGKSESSSSSSFDENVWGPQGDALQGMYQQMQDLWGQSQGGFGSLGDMGNWGGQFNQNVANQGMGGYQDMLAGGSYGDSQDTLNRLYGSMDRQSADGSAMGNMYNSIVGGEGNSYIDPMVDAMRTGSQENLDRNLGMGELDATAMGQGGSSRHAMADSMTTRGALQDMNMNEANMRGGAYDKDMAMKMGIAQQADTNVGNQQDRLLQMLQGRDQNVSGGMQYGQNMQNLGMGAMAPQMQAMMAPWQMMQMYNQGMGSPTVLGSGTQQGDSSGWNAGGSLGIG